MLIPPQLIAEVLTHIIAFLLLFWVLKRFAWRPVISLLDERRRVVRESIEGAEQKEKEAGMLREKYQGMIDRIDEDARTRMNQAIEEGRRIATEITEKARGEAQAIKDKAQRAVQLDIDRARADLRNRVVALTIRASERLLRERLDDPKHHELVARFIDDVEARRA